MCPFPLNILMNTWYKLNINFNDIVKPEWKFPKPNKFMLTTFVVQADSIFKNEWLEDFRNRGFHLHVVRLFHRQPNYNESMAHVDHYFDDNDCLTLPTFGINFVLGGRDSEMVWYELPEYLKPAKDCKFNSDESEKFVTDWSLTKLGPEVNRCNIDSQGTLVNISIPHHIKMSEEPRWCISMRPWNLDLSWDEIVTKMKENNFLC